MNLICDLCGNVLTELDDDHALCNHCGIEYGPDRLKELREAAAAAEPVPPEPEKPAAVSEPKPQKQKSGCLIWSLIILGLLDLVIGTHGIVAVFCLIIILIVSLVSKKK